MQMVRSSWPGISDTKTAGSVAVGLAFGEECACRGTCREASSNGANCAACRELQNSEVAGGSLSFPRRSHS